MHKLVIGMVVGLAACASPKPYTELKPERGPEAELVEEAFTLAGEYVVAWVDGAGKRDSKTVIFGPGSDCAAEFKRVSRRYDGTVFMRSGRIWCAMWDRFSLTVDYVPREDGYFDLDGYLTDKDRKGSAVKGSIGPKVAEPARPTIRAEQETP